MQRGDEVIKPFNDAAENLKAPGAQCLIITCTELSVLANELQNALPVYDASQIFAVEIVRGAQEV